MYNSDFLAGMIGAAIVLLIFVIIVSIAFLVFMLIGWWKLFQKAGEEGWKSLIPGYNTYILIKIAGLNWWWVLVAFAPYVVSLIVNNTTLYNISSLASILTSIVICYNLKEKFHKEQNWFILSVFFSGITIPLLGYSKKDKYDAAAPVKPNAFFG